MQQIDDVVLGWLNGCEEGNPAGPLFIQGIEATEAALTQPNMGAFTTLCSMNGGTTCSNSGGCLCC